MANEVTVTTQLDVIKGSISDSIRKNSMKFDMAGETKSGGIQTVGTTAEQISISADVTAGGYAYFRNVSAANFIDIAVDASVATPLIRLKPGQVALLPVATTTIYAKADTAAVNLEYQVYAA